MTAGWVCEVCHPLDVPEVDTGHSQDHMLPAGGVTGRLVFADGCVWESNDDGSHSFGRPEPDPRVVQAIRIFKPAKFLREWQRMVLEAQRRP